MDADKEFLTEFITCYEMHRCLWDISMPEYICKEKKNVAYKELLGCMLKYKKNGTIVDVKRKINTIRSSYRRELKKIKSSECSGAGVENVYQPKVWWFAACNFLRPFEKPTEGVSTFTDDEVSIVLKKYKNYNFVQFCEQIRNIRSCNFFILFFAPYRP